MVRKVFTASFIFMMLCICSLIDASIAYADSNDIKAAEAEIVKGMRNFDEKIDISSYNVRSEEITSLMSNIFNEYPELFYVKDVYNYYYGSDDIVISVKVQYTNSSSDIKRMISETENEVDKILSKIAPGMTDLQKILIVHDYLALNTEYDYENFQNGSIPYNSYTAYGTMVTKKAVCLGYAKAFMYIMKRLGIECHIIASSKMNHAWNVVKVDGAYYNVDVTKDDVVYDTLGYVSHKRFLLSNNKIEQEDYIIENTKYIASSGKYDDYFWQDVNSAILHNKGKWYYTYNSKIYCYDFKKNISEVLHEMGNEKWYLKDSENYYAASYSRIAVANGNIIFNTPTSIYALNNEGKAAKIYEVDKKDGYIYGLAFLNEVLCYHIKNKASEKGIKYKTKIYQNLTPKAISNTVENNKTNLEEVVSTNATQRKFEDKSRSTTKTTNKNKTVERKELDNNKVENDIESVKNNISTNIIFQINKSSHIKKNIQANGNVMPIVEKVDKKVACIDGGIQKFTLNTNSLSIKAGDKVQLFVGKIFVTEDDAAIDISWSSSNESVVKVDKNGCIQAVAEGRAIVKCKVDSVVKECVINVKMNTIRLASKNFVIDYENQWRITKQCIRKAPKKLNKKKKCFLRRAKNIGKGYKTERLCNRVLKRIEKAG